MATFKDDVALLRRVVEGLDELFLENVVFVDHKVDPKSLSFARQNGCNMAERCTQYQVLK